MPLGAVLALLGGIAAALGHAPFHLWYVAVPGFSLLIWAVSDAATPRRAFWRAWMGALGYFGVTLHWIVEPFLVDAASHGWMAPFALLFLAGGLALFWGLAGNIAFRLGKSTGRRAFAFAVTLTLAEILRGHVFTGFPWALPAYIWAETPVRMAVALIGSYGLSFVTLAGATMPVVLPRPAMGAIAAAALFAVIGAFGHSASDDRKGKSEWLGRVRFLQPNIPQSEKWDPERAPQHFERMLSLTRGNEGYTNRHDMVVWPEAAVVYPLDVAGPMLARASRAAGGKPLVTGINRRENGNWYNSLAVVGSDGTVTETYDKVHLVPFGEYIPFGLSILRAMARTASNGFTPGSQVRLIDTPLGLALPLICYEGIFPDHIFLAGKRPDYLLLLTNDAWFGTFAGPFQHLDQARFRAAEHRLPIVRVANKGVSTVIDPFGRISESVALGADRSAYRDALVWGKSGVTLYSRTGDVPTIVFLLVTIGALSLAKSRNVLAKQSRSS